MMSYGSFLYKLPYFLVQELMWQDTFLASRDSKLLILSSFPRRRYMTDIFNMWHMFLISGEHHDDVGKESPEMVTF